VHLPSLSFACFLHNVTVAEGVGAQVLLSNHLLSFLSANVRLNIWIKKIQRFEIRSHLLCSFSPFTPSPLSPPTVFFFFYFIYYSHSKFEVLSCMSCEGKTEIIIQQKACFAHIMCGPFDLMRLTKRKEILVNGSLR